MKQRQFIDRFDLIVGVVIAGLIVGIAGVVLAGNHVHITIADNGYAPQGTASGSEAIRVRFSDPMNAGSVETHFEMVPAVDGDFMWIDARTVRFAPRQPLAAGQTYTVRIAAGAESKVRGTTLEEDFQWSFTVRLPRVVYLAPSDAFEQNIFMSDLETGAVYQITTIRSGIEDFAVSPNGSEIAYSAYNDDGSIDIWLLDFATFTKRQVTHCVDARCTMPAWRPDGKLMAYQREELNSGLGLGLSPSRVWLLDVTTLDTTLLFSDQQILGYGPVWSPDGQRLAVFDASLPGIRVHDFTARTDVIIESMQGEVGHFAPDGSRLVYPVLLRGALGSQFYTHLEVVDFATSSRTLVSGSDETPVEDGAGVWSPDGQTMLIARRYLDDHYTMGKQIYQRDEITGEIDPLVVDANYNHAAMQWDAAGQRIVFQRFSLTTAGARPEIWVYDLTKDELVRVAENAYFPQWIP